MGVKVVIVANDNLCTKCGKKIERGESTISIMKNLKRLYYHARCFGADHLETPPDKKTEEEKKVANT